MRFAIAIFMLLLGTTAIADCLNESSLQKIGQNEMSYMLGRIPPAFADAVADKKITLATTTADQNACQAKLEITLPQEDVTEVNALLERDPAKKIILFSQGYALPDSTKLYATFNVAPNTYEVAHQDTLHTAELGKLRASVEMMYAMLTQARANVSEDSRNDTPWSQAYSEQYLSNCKKQANAVNCDCQMQQIAKIVTERQMRYVDYINSNPYAHGTGAGKSVSALKRTIDSRCAVKN